MQPIHITKYLLLIPLASLPAQSPAAPVFLQAGKLSCAARLWTPSELQTWCMKGNPLRVVHNTRQDILGGNAFVESFVDNTPGEIPSQVTWMFQHDTTAGRVKYQMTLLVSGHEQNPPLTGVLPQ